MKSLTMKNRKEGGFVLTSELVLIVTILVLGAIVGLVTMRDALTAEMGDVAEAVGTLDQGYCYEGLINGELSASTAGSCYEDLIDANFGDGEPEAFVGAEERVDPLEVIGSTPAEAGSEVAE